MLRLRNSRITGAFTNRNRGTRISRIERINTNMNYSIYSGAGNDFVMIDNRDYSVPFGKQKDFTITICEEQFKDIDGVIFLEKPVMEDAAIRMNYYNRDGSYGAMCGNGARCIAQFAADNGI